MAEIPLFCGVSESSLIPLYFRAVESQAADPMIVDPVAVEIVDRLAYDFSTIDANGADRVFAIMRARQFDRYARAFLAKNRDAVVVDLGCGLDTRFARVDNGAMEWFGIDLPNVIECRRTLLKEGVRCHLVASSLLDSRWMDLLPDDAGRARLFLAEGVFMYLEGREVRSLVKALAERFPGSALVFDGMSPLFVWLHNRQAILRRLDVLLRWGLRNPREPETWAPNVRLLDCWSYFDEPERRLGRLAWLRYVPGVRMGNVIVRCEIGALAL
jgi:methyltransferase (TIGR00027 family)